MPDCRLRDYCMLYEHDAHTPVGFERRLVAFEEDAVEHIAPTFLQPRIVELDFFGYSVESCAVEEDLDSRGLQEQFARGDPGLAGRHES